MENKNISKVSFALSLVALILSAVVSLFGVELYLAGTQWALVSIIFAVYAVYLNND